MATNLFLLLVKALFSSKEDYILENAQLRQQLGSMVFCNKRPRITDEQRHFFYMLSQKWDKWKEAMVIVKPNTVKGWHDKAFKWYWKRISKSKSKPLGRPTISQEIIDLIVEMATENNWRAVRVHGELLKLGFDVSERTVSRYLPKKESNGDSQT